MVVATIMLVLLGLFFAPLRRMLIMGVILIFALSWAYTAVMGRVQQMQQNVNASVDKVVGAPGRAIGVLKDKVMGLLAGEGWGAIGPLWGAAAENTELYEYCLANVAYLDLGTPQQCEAMKGRARTECFERTIGELKQVRGIADPGQIDDGRMLVKNGCRAAFLTNNAMNKLMVAGIEAGSVVYKHCDVPGTCEGPKLDSDEYRQCLYERFVGSPRNGGLGLKSMYCDRYVPEDLEKWRKCTEVSMVVQTAGDNLGQSLPDNRGMLAIAACRAQVK